jgi:enoyl-CoA hydratase
MVTKVYPKDQLAEKTLAFARRIANVPTMAALMIKESVNQSVDQMGFYNALQSCFSLHQLNHSHWAEIHAGGPSEGFPCATVEDGVVDWRNPPPIQMSRKDS